MSWIKATDIKTIAMQPFRMTVWLPIETAPKDGTRIICWGPQLAVAECEWREQWHHHGAGWYRSNQHPIVEPTHWTPLPHPPDFNTAK